MKASLKNFRVNSWAGPAEFRPDNPQCFGFWLTAEIGAEEAVGTELFQVFVFNEAWLDRGPASIPEYGTIRPRQRHVVVDDPYDEGSVRARLEQYLDGCEGESWKEVVEQVARIGFSEYEDHHS